MKNPWEEKIDPEEFIEYYEWKKENLEHECRWEGCEETVEFPRDYCRYPCFGKALRKVHKEIMESND